MAKKVLIAVSEHGFWVEELLKPLDRLQEAGIEYDFIVATGEKTPFPDAGSLNASYVDPPLGRPVTSREMAERGRTTDWEAMFANRMVLTDWFPVRPYLSAGAGEAGYLVALEQYYTARQKTWDERLGAYDALLLVGGGGPILDMVNNSRLHNLILGFYYANKPIAAECYTVTCLAFAREFDTRRSILHGKHVTGHTMEYDYTSGWAIYENDAWVKFEAPPYPLEYILRDTVGPDGEFHGNVGRVTSVIVDYPFITSRSVASSDLCGQKLVEVLNEGLTRWGW
jgi:putative intracellular protease/amidase